MSLCNYIRLETRAWNESQTAQGTPYQTCLCKTASRFLLETEAQVLEVNLVKWGIFPRDRLMRPSTLLAESMYLKPFRASITKTPSRASQSMNDFARNVVCNALSGNAKQSNARESLAKTR